MIGPARQIEDEAKQGIPAGPQIAAKRVSVRAPEAVSRQRQAINGDAGAGVPELDEK